MSFKVYKSSAGSGKTFTLVFEYLKLALSSDNPKKYKSIMAVTFTNKAANEMKERVINYLTALSNKTANSGAQLIVKNKLLHEFNIYENELEQRAYNTLKSILHEYSDFNISTIDKFILKIIRSFSIDFNIPMNFDIEMDTESIIRLAVENVVASVGSNKDNTRFLLEYVKQQAEEDKDWSITEALIQFSKNALNEKSSNYLGAIKKFKYADFLAAKKTCDDYKDTYLAKISSFVKDGKQLISKEGLTSDDVHGKTTSSVWSYYCKPPKNFEYQATSNKQVAAFEREDWSTKDSKTIINSSTQSRLYELFQKIEFLKTEELPKVQAAIAVSKKLFQLALINEIESEITNLKKEHNFVQLSEFNERVAEIVVQQPVPFIYERIGEKYSNYLIDEFQDTSELQWQNLMPLVENSLAYNNFNLLVGDVKQAIYRWRGGNVQQFQQIENNNYFTENPIINERLLNIRRYIQSDTLSTNYRSLPVVIEFNNLFFKSLLASLSINFNESYYSDYKQKIGTAQKGGYVEVNLQTSEDEENADEYNLNHCLETVKDCIERGYNYADIAILTRTNTISKKIGNTWY